MKIVHLSIIFLIIAMKAASLFLTNLLNIQISYAVCMQSLLSNNFFHQFFYSFSLSRKWQVPSATVNRVLLSQISIELSLLLNRYWKFFKNDSFIRKEKQTSAPKQMAESNSRLSAPRGLLVFHQMFVYTVAIYLSISDDVDASSIDQKYM